jgi:hypothetical protein
MAKYVEDIKDAGGGFPFTVNYDPAIIKQVQELRALNEELDFEVWFGGVENPDGTATPTGEDGAVNFSGNIGYQITGAGTRAVRPATITLYPTTDPAWNEEPIYELYVDPTAPTAPRNFVATPGDTEVTLAWISPLSDGGSAITGYQVSSDNGTTFVTADSNTGHLFTGLTNDQLYTFQVRAVNVIGNGAVATTTATPTI